MADHEARHPARQMHLAELVAAAQRRWGVNALVQGARRLSTPPLAPTGLAALDALLGGGLPRGVLTEFLATPTCGMTTIAFTALARTQARGEIGVFLDMHMTFDGAYAAACGVDLPSLLLVRPSGVSDALELIEALLTSGGVGLLVADWRAPHGTHDRALLAPALHRLLLTIAPHPGALVVLTPMRPARATARAPNFTSPFAQVAALRLHITRQGWAPESDPPMCTVGLTVVKRRGGVDGQRGELQVTFPDD
jgi:hypothetical protein